VNAYRFALCAMHLGLSAQRLELCALRSAPCDLLRALCVSSAADGERELLNFNNLRNRLFYTLKPFIPRRLQISLRRRIAQYKRRKYAHIWPIDPNTATPPHGWRGWPDGKQFAFVLSHDVDNHKGQERVLELAKLEMKLGFRSAFNFVPERYANHNEVKAWLKANGFEINVHGLKHDGKLFSNRRTFEQQAVRINQYLKEWEVSGFTAPSMLCNADWLHELDITHSISTFDTDPFEPQPNSTPKIFPFWVQNGSSQEGYVELPYTLPQDHLLFVILREKDTDMWKQKLDWTAAQGGMALLNTHSDYMNFKDTQPLNEEYPVEYYVEFLEYVKSEYAGQFWHANPFEIASYWKRHMVDDG
jgi:hypothetical protein